MSLPFPLSMRRALLALAIAALAAMAFATSASAATATGEVALTLKKGAKSSLLREGVKVTPGSGKGKTRTVKLAIADLDLATKTVSSGAVLTFRTKGKSVKLRELQLKAGAKSTALSAKQGGKRKVFFRIQGNPLEIGTALSAKGSLALTGTGAKALRDALGLDGISGGKLGSGSFSAFISELKPVTPPADKPKGPEEPQGDSYPYAAECPVPAVEGNPGFGEAPGKVSGIEPEPLFSPGVSQEVTGTEIDWGFKDSFRSYVLAVPPAGTLQTLDGAVAHPNGTMLVPGSYFEFPASEGTYEPGSSPDHSDDKLVVEGTGTVLFCKTGHGFNIAMKDPTVTIDGEDSRITATVGANMNGTWYPFQRADIANLDVGAPVVTDGGNTLVWEDLAVEMSEDGELAFGAIYPAEEPLDDITIKTSLDRPLLAECPIAAGTVETPPAVNFTLTPLPTLTNPVTAEGENLGTIDWGVRRATRNSVTLAGGTFPLLGGATASHPGNMGGAAGAPPTGGTGKFFRFPISSYEYEAGTADPKDDRLIATSDATISFCNPAQGNFGVVLSKPTLVIDGANSRLIANAYSFGGGFPAPSPQGWIGGRVELVDLDPSTIDAVAAAGKVNWGDTPAGEEAIVSGIPVTGGWQTSALSLASLTEGSGTGGFDPVTAQIVLPAP